MEKLYKAFVTDKETKQKKFITSSYTSADAFYRDLRANGYSVSRIELAVIYDFVLDNTNCNSWDFSDAKELYNKGVELIRDNFEKYRENKFLNK